HSVNQNYSEKAKSLMKRDFAVEDTKEYDSIRGFLGESLPRGSVELYSKPGWTSGSRQDAAIIYDTVSGARYILVVIGDDKGYATDEEIFPAISGYIYEQMSR
ncbi:MAG: hypothetical protein AAFU53_20860, partial [Cyanobacteria bacterium J06632_3]